MPYRSLVAKELATFLKAVAHPARIRVIEELRSRELDVNGLQAVLRTSHSSVSQHLMVLRAHRLVVERREGRHMFYSLRGPELADWLVAAMDLLSKATADGRQLQAAIRKSRIDWQSTKRSMNPTNRRAT
jgi:DNA-binding transcriptional ArsR family regulator